VQDSEQIARPSGQFEQDFVWLLPAAGRVLSRTGDRACRFRRPRDVWRKRDRYLGAALLSLGNRRRRLCLRILRGAGSADQVELSLRSHARSCARSPQIVACVHDATANRALIDVEAAGQIRLRRGADIEHMTMKCLFDDTARAMLQGVDAAARVPNVYRCDATTLRPPFLPLTSLVGLKFTDIGIRLVGGVLRQKANDQRETDGNLSKAGAPAALQRALVPAPHWERRGN
jgi:hypothetical protein